VPLLRRAANLAYRPLPIRLKARLFERYGGIFIGRSVRFTPGHWSIDFAATRVRQPLRPELMRLDWGHALGMIGHDWQVKETYRRLLCSHHRPQLYVDVGANYGTHSLLFLEHGIRTITVEPNPLCREYFTEVCRLNAIRGHHVEPVALGEETKPVTLWFPADATWLGTVSETVRRELAKRGPLESRIVRQVRFDDLLQMLVEGAGAGRILVKIDTEGSEAGVIRGAPRTLREARPLIVFESLPGPAREELFALLRDADYRIAGLPWDPEEPSPARPLSDFRVASATNFMTYPAEHRF